MFISVICCEHPVSTEVRCRLCQYTGQTKRHRLWFSTKSCGCYSTKTYVNSLILILKLNLTSLKGVWCSTKTTFTRNVYVFHQSQIQFQDEDHAVFISFRWVTSTWHCWEPQPVRLRLHPVNYKRINMYGAKRRSVFYV